MPRAPLLCSLALLGLLGACAGSDSSTSGKSAFRPMVDFGGGQGEIVPPEPAGDLGAPGKDARPSPAADGGPAPSTEAGTTPVTGQLFTDVPPDSPFYDAIQWVGIHGYFVGCASTAFCPTKPLTRAELAAALVKMKYGTSTTASTTPHFQDVPASHWAFKPIQRLADDGVTAGCGGGNFCPEVSALRAEAAALLAHLKYGPTVSGSTTPYYTDVPASHWAFPAVQRLTDEQIATGCGGTLYCPAASVSRQECAALLYRAQSL